MKKLGRGVEIFFKVIGCYLTIFAVAVVLLGLEVRQKTPLSRLECLDYAVELKAERVTKVTSYYGAVRFDIEVAALEQEELLLARTLKFAQVHELGSSHYLYTSPDDSTYIVVTAEYDAYVES